ncbi:hypothetical protein Q3G72_009338 [Acer saccharum]|nr:hypothetical protein Q3G72_009338 [Acer saccharum]
MEIVGYKEPTSFWHTSIVSLERSIHHYEHYVMIKQIPSDPYVPLVDEKEESLQQQGLPYLILKECVCLEKLPQALHSLSFLRKICIANCYNVVSFAEVGLPTQLESIRIESCDALESLPKSWMDSTSLKQLYIERCKSLAYIARNQLLPNLKVLVISSCDNLQTLMQVEEHNIHSSLSAIGVCPSTPSSMTKSKLPDTLEYVYIYYCSNLASLSSSEKKMATPLIYHNENINNSPSSLSVKNSKSLSNCSGPASSAFKIRYLRMPSTKTSVKEDNIGT